jgi:hypothetical protein
LFALFFFYLSHFFVFVVRFFVLLLLCALPQADEFPVDEQNALRLAGLQAQVMWGEPKEDQKSRYNDVCAYLPRRIVMSMLDGDVEFWKTQIFEAHKKFGRDPKGNWFTDIRAMTMYLTLVKQCVKKHPSL